VKSIVQGLVASLNGSGGRAEEVYSFTTESISALLSANADYFEQGKHVDLKLETMAERKIRFSKSEILEKRSMFHSKIAVECGLMKILIDHIDHDNPNIRHHASICLSKLLNSFNNEEETKGILLAYLEGYAEDLGQSEQKVVELRDEPPINVCRKRAALEATLMVAKPDLGMWAIRKPGGVEQIRLLIVTGDQRCQSIAAELMCLTAATEAASLLSPMYIIFHLYFFIMIFNLLK
jgi:hypothetical protein